MPVYTEITKDQFAVNLGEDLGADLQSLAIKQVSPGVYSICFQVKFPTIKEFDGATPANNKFQPTDGSFAVLPTSAIDPSKLEQPDLFMVSTAGEEIKLSVEMKVPGSGKGNHG